MQTHVRKHTYTRTQAPFSQARQPTGSTKAPGRLSSTAGCTLLKGWRAAQVGQKQTMQPYRWHSDEERLGSGEQLQRFSAPWSTHTSLASFPMFDSTYVWTPDNTWGKLIGPSQGEGLRLSAVCGTTHTRTHTHSHTDKHLQTRVFFFLPAQPFLKTTVDE